MIKDAVNMENLICLLATVRTFKVTVHYGQWNPEFLVPKWIYFWKSRSKKKRQNPLFNFIKIKSQETLSPLGESTIYVEYPNIVS